MSEEQLHTELEAAGFQAEDVEMMTEISAEMQADFARTGQLSSLFGMKAFGSSEEGVNACIAAGANLVKQGLYLKATEFFVGMLQFEPFHPRVHMWLGLCAQKQKLYGRALQFFRQAKGLGSPDPVILFYLGEMALFLDEAEEGREALLAGIELAQGKKELAPYLLRAQKLLSANTEKNDGK